MLRNGIKRKRMWIQKQHLIVIILCFSVLMTTLLSTVYIIHEENHVCTGDDCPICACIRQCENFLEQISTGLIKLSFSITLYILPIVSLVVISESVVVYTLVNQKVRLND